MINKSKKIVIGTMIGFLLSTNVAVAEEPKGSTDPGQNPISLCEVTLSPIYEKQLADFFTFLDENFQNKSANSSLTNTAIIRYTRYKKSIKDTFGRLAPAASSLSQKNNVAFDEIQAYEDCKVLTENYLVWAKKEMMDRIKSSSNQKNAAILIEKYQAINAQLRELNTTIAKMYGLFMTFSNKLPGYLSKCVKK